MNVLFFIHLTFEKLNVIAMEFGRVPENELDNIDFSLPKEPSFNKQILSGKKNKNAKVYVGCAKWGREEWVGKIYPLKTKE
ncbi:hypothetical protein E3E36_11410, partial [Thermococcus sp. M36]|uniref:hypothetical protein n=1 Tax=Thermococcus sp. M36 TaxID=1638261 RepID=UPI001694244D